jgi:hypothetical protein
MFLWIGDGRRGANEARIAAVEAAQPLQPAQDVGDVAAEDAAVDVDLIDDNVLQPAEQRPPRRVVGQDAGVEHVGVGEQQPRRLADAAALRRRRVAVIRGDGGRLVKLRGEAIQLRQLVVRQRLGGKEVECTRGGIRQQHVHYGQVIA